MSSLQFAAKGYFFQEKRAIFKYCPFCENTLLINILWGNPPPNNCPYSSGKGVVKIVQIWHREVQSEIVQSSTQIIARDRHDSNDLSARKKMRNLVIWVRSGDWDGSWMVDIFCRFNHAPVQRAVWAGALSCWNTNGSCLSLNMFFRESIKFSDNGMI